MPATSALRMTGLIDPPTGVEKVPVKRDRDWKVYQEDREKSLGDMEPYRFST
jgi:hypothetical protein